MNAVGGEMCFPLSRCLRAAAEFRGAKPGVQHDAHYRA